MPNQAILFLQNGKSQNMGYPLFSLTSSIIYYITQDQCTLIEQLPKYSHLANIQYKDIYTQLLERQQDTRT